MAKLVLLFASVSGALSVGLGAFGAHALRSRLESSGRLDTFQTAVQYQFIHTIALLVIGLLMTKYQSQWLNYSGYTMMVGILIFSGSLYTLAIGNIRWLGAVTPLGGLGLIIGWVCLTIAVWQIKF